MLITSTNAAALVPALSAYAGQLHAHAGKEHHVASPLGAWILLALCSTGSEGRLRDELTRILGADVDAAAAFAAGLLAEPHPAVELAAGVWTSRHLRADRAAAWLTNLPSAIDRGELPKQKALDAWARAHTHGMIDRFPAELDPATVLLLATVMATNVRWREPFVAVTAAHRGLVPSEMWSGEVQRVLKTPAGDSHQQFIAASARAGDVAVHVVDSDEGVAVTSVIAERDVPPADVIATAYEVGCGRYIPKRSLFDLPLGISPLWRITEEPVETLAPDERDEKYEAVLPAWTATRWHDLRREELGFPAAAAALEPIIGLHDYPYQATQAVTARYGRLGFTASALSAFHSRLSRHGHGRVAPRGVRRIATLQFGHPFAVVATATDTQRRMQFGPWHRVPVYSAWVAEPSEADEETW